MREIIVYAVIAIVSLVAIVGFNYYTNQLKYDQCTEAGGEFFYNSADANLSFCKVNSK